MDSQITLVNLERPTGILFNSSCLKTSSISLSTDPQTPLYVLRVPTSGALDVYSPRAECVISAVRKRSMLPDIVMFQEGSTKQTMRVDRWLKKGTSPHKHPVRKMSLAPGLSCYWKSDKQYRLALYDSEDHEDPIATYSPGRKPGSHIVIQLTREHEVLTSHMLEVLVSFIIMERKIRSHEKGNWLLLAMAREESLY